MTCSGGGGARFRANTPCTIRARGRDAPAELPRSACICVHLRFLFLCRSRARGKNPMHHENGSRPMSRTECRRRQEDGRVMPGHDGGWRLSRRPIRDRGKNSMHQCGRGVVGATARQNPMHLYEGALGAGTVSGRMAGTGPGHDGGWRLSRRPIRDRGRTPCTCTREPWGCWRRLGAPCRFVQRQRARFRASTPCTIRPGDRQPPVASPRSTCIRGSPFLATAHTKEEPHTPEDQRRWPCRPRWRP
jgi:hypothetical protein